MPSVSDGISAFNLHGRFNMKKLAVLTALAGCKEQAAQKPPVDQSRIVYILMTKKPGNA